MEEEVVYDAVETFDTFPAVIVQDDGIALSESEDVVEEQVEEVIAIIPRKITITRDYIHLPEEGDGQGDGEGEGTGKGGVGDMSEFLRKIQEAREQLEGLNGGDPYDDSSEGDASDNTAAEAQHTLASTDGERFNVRKKERF
jgi:hypothetical protein